jgi:hypothetical protein
VGKTTLARMYADYAQKQFPAIHVFDLENPQDVAALTHAQLTLSHLEG